MSLDNDENEYFGEETEPSGGNGDEQSNRTFRMAVLGLAGIGALGVLLLALIFIGKQGQNDVFRATQQAVYATNTAVAILSLVTPTPVPTDTPQPTSTAAPTATPRPVPTNTPGPKDIVDTALGSSNFKTLAAALKATGLDQVLKGQGPFTLFAPTDDAFAKLPTGALDALMNDPQELATILKYHVVQSAEKAADMAKIASAKTLEGDSITVAVKDGTPTINNAKVTEPDLVAANGVIHGIDTVLLPPGVDLRTIAQAAGTPGSKSPTTPAKATQTTAQAGATPGGTQIAQQSTLVPTRIPPQAATATAAASKNITGTVSSKGTPQPGAGTVPQTGAGDYGWLLLAMGLIAIVFIARRMRTSQV